MPRQIRTGIPPTCWEADIFGSGRGTSERIRLGEAIYDKATGRLISASNEEILLRSQSAQVLEALTDFLGTLAPRDTLIERVWGGVAVTDDSLTQCIADIRRALGDHDRALLKTVPKRGYQLTGEVIALPPAQNAGTAIAAADANGGIILADLDPRDVLPTLAVLPMRGSFETRQDPLGIFVADEIANALGRSEDMNVISRLSTAQFWGELGQHSNLRQALNADFVVSGLAHSQNDIVVLSVELADADSGIALWSDRIRLPLGPLMTDTDWVEHVVSQLRNAIMVNEVRRVRSRPLEDLKLFSVLHGAVGLMHRLSPKDFNEARSLLRFVAEKAPYNPAPLAWMARWHVLRAMQGWSEDVQQEATSAIECAEQALDIDPENTLALTSLGFVMTNLLHRLDEAHGYYDNALLINPNDAQARALRGMLLAFTDNGSDGKRDVERALHLTPRDPHRFFYLALASGVHLSAENYDRSVLLAKESLRLNKTHISTLRMLAAAQMGAGDEDASRATVAELMRLQPDLRVSTWTQSAPSREYDNGKRVATLLRAAGVPD